ncbi:MAG: Mov34/MPN/PAD-1 family protein [Pirellulaceae bacterium]
MDLDIQFGDLEEAQPEAHLRPDRNKHFAVVPYESPDEGDLPIFVDLDVMRDIESHAVSDTSVELGGVLLGGQYQDDEGRHFVVVTDSLRAHHFEATKGSFKFTHDTWEKISRERDEFPENLQMVGWYHTHPDWGVFLSSMDMFICDNFFNRPLDLALVVDPCRRDRGMFQWTGDNRERIRRTGGFYLTASRFRRQELEFFVAQLEGKFTMTTSDPRFAAYPMQAPSPAPVINIAEPRNTWQAPAIAGMLTVQLLVLVLLAWKLLAPGAALAEEDEKPKKEPTVAEQIDELERTLTRRLDDQALSQSRHDAQERLLKALIAEMHGDQGKIVNDYEVQQQTLDRLTSNLEGQRALVDELKTTKNTLTAELEKTKNNYVALDTRLKTANKAKEETAKKRDEYKAQADNRAKQIEELEKQVSGEVPAPGTTRFWIYIGLAVVGGAALGAVAVVVASRRPLEEDFDGPSEEPFQAQSADPPPGDGKPADEADDAPSESTNPDRIDPESSGPAPPKRGE